MIDTMPRPIVHRRLEKLIKGLQQRLDGSLHRNAEQVARIQVSIETEQSKYSDARTRLEKARANQAIVSTTAWDEAIHDCWDQQERIAYHAIRETSVREGKLRQEAKTKTDAVTNEAKQKIADIEKRFLRSKDVPLNRLKAFRSENKGALEKLTEVEHAARGALTRRGLSVPADPAGASASQQAFTSTPQPLHAQPANAESALAACRSTIDKVQVHCQRLNDNALARFFDSFWWWGACGLLFVIVTTGSVTLFSQPPIHAVLWGAVVTLVLLLLGFIGVRPWLKRSASAEFPMIVELIDHGKRLVQLGEQLAVAENDEELIRLAKIRDERYQQTKKWRDAQALEIANTTSQAIRELHQWAKDQKLTSSRQLTAGIQSIDTRFESRVADEGQRHAEELQRMTESLTELQLRFTAEIDNLNRIRSQRLEAAFRKANHAIRSSSRWCLERFPAWEDLHRTASDWPATYDEPLLPIGSLDLGLYLPGLQELSGERESLPDLQHPVSLLFSPLEDEYLVISGDPNEKAVRHLVRILIMRVLTSLPAGGVQVCVVDPPGLGRDFGWLMHLGDFDADLVSHRVWTQPGHITKQVSSLAMAAENFIQQSLRNEYPSIVEYNRVAGSLAEPFRILLWNSFPHGLDDQSWKGMQSLLDAGARCGIIPILVVDPAATWSAPEQRDWIARRGLHLALTDDRQCFHIASSTVDDLRLQLESVPSDTESQRLVQEVGRRALLANRVEVPLDKMLPQPDELWTGDSTSCLEIPIGQSGVGRTHSLKLGIGTAQHAMIAGKTGSGKSSLLHAMITSAILKYAPGQLRLVLLDFKKGVEFQIYAEAQIPHADIIGIESQREFGLSALQFVDSCMQQRGERFRQAGVQDLASWNALHPTDPVPRMLVVVDEFQELFVEDDKLAGQASLLLDRIVRQGRSFGVHAVLSSQTLAGAYSLPRTTLGQMAVRIALQCDASDAQIIFSEDNPGAARLKHPGQAVYNDAGGRIEGNQPMQIGWLTKEEQVRWFASMEHGYRNDDPTTNALGRTVVYDGNRAAKWESAKADLAISRAKQELNPDATWCVVGESVAISPAVTFPITKQSGRNVLIVGNNDAQAASVLYVINASLARDAQQRGQTASLVVVQGARPTDARALALPRMWENLNCQLEKADIRGTDKLLAEVHGTVLQRLAEENTSPDLAPVFLNLIQLGRLRSLKKEDEFGLGSFGESELTPEKQLDAILRDGPSVGVHTIVWAENYSTVNRWLSRGSLRELEIRLLMQMSANDSTNLIDSVEASRMGEHVMLLADEATGIEQRFRPFDFESLSATW